LTEPIHVIDSHTGGEPTRVVVSGFPEVKGATMAEKRLDFANRFDDYRKAIVCEPRGSDVIVGALITEACEPSCDLGVIFFNNKGVLNMCGHGTIGLAETLRYMNPEKFGQKSEFRLDTSAGVVIVHANEDRSFTLQNVPSYRYKKDVPLEVPGIGLFHGDIAWGGNWFYLCNDHGKELNYADRDALSRLTIAMMEALEQQGIFGEDGGIIDHVELIGPAQGDADARNFVMCPGGAYDRSPCGTGTSAKVACLAADGKLKEGEVWRQESITGSIFRADYIMGENGKILPRITGRAWVNAESKQVFDPEDPLAWGIH
jgi:4-hydroxyproline epimerase